MSFQVNAQVPLKSNKTKLDTHFSKQINKQIFFLWSNPYKYFILPFCMPYLLILFVCSFV